MIKAIIFDLWETLGTKNVGISKTFFEHFDVPNDQRDIKEYEKAVQLQAWDSEQTMINALLSRFQINANEVNNNWGRDLFREGIEKATLFPGIFELLNSLKEKYKLALISNTTVFESVVLGKFDLINTFDVVTWSWEVGKLKPAPEIFQHTLQLLNIAPEESVFIDDGQKNITAAQALGMEGILIKDVETLKTSLRELGVSFE